VKYLLTLVIIPAIYSFSFAKYTWKEKNKTGSIGIVCITFLSIALAIYYMFYFS
jgi:hypothetical protein